ncbi:hypothetical protein ACVGWY_02585, partial [Enterobacter intestinihominis]
LIWLIRRIIITSKGNEAFRGSAPTGAGVKNMAIQSLHFRNGSVSLREVFVSSRAYDPLS